jgi:hypothetical protein
VIFKHHQPVGDFPLDTNKCGAALVTTVIVVAVLAVVAVAFMQSNTADLTGSRSVVNHLRAQMAAEAGGAAAVATVADLIARYPDSVTVWQNIGGGEVNGTSNEATVLYFRSAGGDSNAGASPAAFGSQVGLWAIPLVSRTNSPTSLDVSPVPLGEIVRSVPIESESTVNINSTSGPLTDPFIGTRTSTNSGDPITAGQWVYLTQYGGPTNATNPYVARFAYWVEDESFKVNVNVATNGLRGTGSLGLGPAEISIDGAWRASTNNSLANANTAAVINGRSIFGATGYPTIRSAAFSALGHAANITNTAEIRFLTTKHSAGLDLSRGGFKRVDINAVASGPNVRTNLDRLIAAITNSNAAPNFGQRFYRFNNVNSTNAVQEEGDLQSVNNHALIYLNKLAVNIVDYIDSDNQPTVVNSDSAYSLRTGKPDFGIEPLGGGTDGDNSVVAFGVENLPRLQEYAIHVRIRSLSPLGFHTNSVPANIIADYLISIDHYFEFWNPSIKDAILPNNAFLKVYDQPSFGTNGGVTGLLALEGRPFEVPLTTNGVGVLFPAGKATVITTAPIGEVNTNLIRNPYNIISMPVDNSDRIFSGTTSEFNSQSPLINGFNRVFSIAMRGRSGSSGYSDYQSGVLIGNDLGILESFVGLPIPTPGGSYAIHVRVTNNAIMQSINNITNGNVFYVRGGSLRGNMGSGSSVQPLSAEGDPRALNEQMVFVNYTTSSNANETRFYNSGSSSTNIPTNSTLGLPNTNYVDPSVWVDYSLINGFSSASPLIVADETMRTIGDLGNITDPARVPGTNGSLTNVVYSRGGGRTLRIGQPELSSWYDGDQTNASRTWTSWRLADIFTTTNAVTIVGLINPNGVLRDGGVALRGALHGFTYLPSPNGAPNTAGATLNSNNITTLVTNIISRMTNTNSFNPSGSLNPFWERGEISQLDVLNTGTALLGSGINLSSTIDRGREELVRRTLQMLTTRGSIFTTYVIGQAIQVTGSSTNVSSTSRMRQVFELKPNGLDLNDTFNPVDSSEIFSRFGRPSGYDVHILSTFYD